MVVALHRVADSLVNSVKVLDTVFHSPEGIPTVGVVITVLTIQGVSTEDGFNKFPFNIVQRGAAVCLGVVHCSILFLIQRYDKFLIFAIVRMTFFGYLQYFFTFVGNQGIIGMKIGQSVIILTMKDTGKMYLFGSLSAIYGMFNHEQLDVSYPALRNAVGSYIKNNQVDESEPFSQVIYDTKRSTFTLQRAPLWLLEREKKQDKED